MPATYSTAARNASGVAAPHRRARSSGSSSGACRVRLDERLEKPAHPAPLLDGVRPQVDALVVPLPERRQSLGAVDCHADRPRLLDRLDDAGDERRDLGGARRPAALRDEGGQILRADDPGGDRVLEVVTDVGDPIRPGQHLALGSRRRGARPGVVPHGVERLLAQVEGPQRDIGSPRGVVETPFDERAERLLAGVPARAVPAVVGDRRGVDEILVEACRPGDRQCDLGDLHRVRETRPLVVERIDEDLGLARQAAERGGMEHPVTVALETGPQRIRFLGPGPRPCADGPRGPRCEDGVLFGFALRARSPNDRASSCVARGVGDAHPGVGVEEVTLHRRRPDRGAVRRRAPGGRAAPPVFRIPRRSHGSSLRGRATGTGSGSRVSDGRRGEIARFARAQVMLSSRR